ncbi:tellurite resistance TerB family protein [Roseobacteraceae bacterium S113]
MGLMGTLAKVAMGYAAAKGVQHLSQNGGLGGLLGGATVKPDEARAPQNAGMAGLPGMDQLQGMMQGGAGGAGGLQDMMAGLMGGGAAGGANPAAGMQEMMSKLTGGGAGGLQDMMAGLMGGGQQASAPGGGMLSGGGGGAGLAGLLAMAGTAAAATGGGAGALLDAFNTKETAPEAEEAAGLMIRAMIQAAKSDGDIDAEEQSKIIELMGDDADAEDLAFVRAQLAAPVDIDALAADTPAMQKMQVYSMSLMSIKVDTPAEAQYLDQLAGALGLDQQTVNGLHMQMGVQPLYG